VYCKDVVKSARGMFIEEEEGEEREIVEKCKLKVEREAKKIILLQIEFGKTSSGSRLRRRRRKRGIKFNSIQKSEMEIFC
jgi:hypothetical protein